jgi:stress response protein YsnF
MKITLKDGRNAEIFDDPADQRYALVRLDDGRSLRVERSLVEKRDEGYYLPLSAVDLADADTEQTTRLKGRPDREQIVVPVIGEELHVRPETREIGAVRVHKTVQEHEEVIDQPVIKERVDVKRVAVNQVVNEFLPVRQMGDTMIIPLIEEVLKIEKQLILREEIHVTRIRSEERVQQKVPVRREDATLERVNEHGESVPIAAPRETVAERVDRKPAEGEARPLQYKPPARKNKIIK